MSDGVSGSFRHSTRTNAKKLSHVRNMLDAGMTTSDILGVPNTRGTFLGVPIILGSALGFLCSWKLPCAKLMVGQFSSVGLYLSSGKEESLNPIVPLK